MRQKQLSQDSAALSLPLAVAGSVLLAGMLQACVTDTDASIDGQSNAQDHTIFMPIATGNPGPTKQYELVPPLCTVSAEGEQHARLGRGAGITSRDTR